MNVKIHDVRGEQVAEMLSDGIVVRSSRDVLDIVGEMLSRGLKRLILNERNVSPEFFQLKTGLAGDILQKLTNYRIKIALVGQFTSSRGKSLQAFIAESNRGGEICFTDSLEAALELMGGR